jgi:hypothetical protein
VRLLNQRRDLFLGYSSASAATAGAIKQLSTEPRR